MAREHKLILIIGFSLFLVVAVLISDHMSQARSARLAEASEVVSPLPSQPVAMLRQTTVPRSLPGEREATTGAQNGSAASTDDTWPPRGSAGLIPSQPTHIGNGPGASGVDSIGNGSGGEAAPARIDPDAWRAWIPGAGERDGGEASGGGRQDRAEERRPGPIPEPVVRTKPTEPEPAVPLEYIVQANDSLYRIAERYFGDGNRWREIAAFNMGKVGDNGSVRVGVRILIPPEGVVVRAGEPEAEAPAKPRARTENGSAGPGTYVVQKGDTLGQIALRLLGSSRRAGEIIKANTGKIDDADEIYVGMKLTIPAR